MRAYATSGALASVIISVCLTLTIVRADPRDIYAGLCRDEEIGLTKVSQVGPLISFVNSPDASTIGCDPEVKDAILDLAEPLQVDDPDNHCTVERVNRIINYLYKHVRPQEPTEEVPEPVVPMHTPKALKRFFVSYALTVSKICKLGMLKLLMKDSKSLVERDDYNEVLRWTEGSDKQTKTFLGRAINYDDIFLVGNALCDSELQACRKLYVQNVYWERLRSMRNTCHRVFRPFYGQLIMPIVRLANAGIDYMDSKLRDSLDDLRENPDLQKWYKVVFLCESLANVIALPPPKQEHHEPEVVVDEEALKKIDEEERKELEVEVEEEGEEVVDVIHLNQDCPAAVQKETDENGRHVVLEKKESVTKDGVEIVELTECEDGKKVIKIKKKRAHKSKGLGSMLFGKDTYLAKELRRLQQERRAYLLSKKSMPVTNVMLKKDVLKYEQEHGPIDVDDFGNEPDVEYKPKPMIHIGDDLMPLTDRRIIKAIRKYEKRRKQWRKVLRRISRKYVRLFKRITLLGRVKFGGKQKQKVETEELMFRVFDNAMWRKANPEMVKQEKGIWRKMLEFQNISNVATCVSMTLGIIFFILSCTLGLGR